MAFSNKQMGVLRGITAAIAVTLIVFAAAVLLPVGPARPLDAGDRLAYALRADCAVVACLAVSIAALARHRFFTPEDIDGGGLGAGSDRARALQALLQNTLEQTVLAVTAHLVFASLAPPDWLDLIPASAGLFVIGRILFWRGYAAGAPARALGFGLTFYPSLLLIGLSVLFLISGAMP